MNLCTSANNCNETLTKAQQNTRVELIAFDPGDA